MHLDDETRVAESGSKTNDGGIKLDEVLISADEIRKLEESSVRNENVDGMNALELIKYEKRLKKHLKDIAREITKVYEAKTQRRMKGLI